MVLKIAILGSGSVGCACAAYFTLRGFKVNLYDFPEFNESIKLIVETGGIYLGGVGIHATTGFAKMNMITTDIREAIQGTDVVYVCVPAFVHKRIAEAIAPHLADGQILCVDGCAGGGALVFAKIFQNLDITRSVILGEVSTAGFGARRIGSAISYVFGYKYPPKPFYFAAFPSKNNNKMSTVLREMWAEAAPKPLGHVLQCLLCNTNVVHHPAAMILNAGRIEFSMERGILFSMYQEGYWPSCVKRVKDAVDEERLKLLNHFGMIGKKVDKFSGKRSYDERVEPIIDIATYGPMSLQHRFLVEDVPYGLTPMAQLGDAYDVPTPTMKSIINLASVISKVDYMKEGRTLERLGINGMTIDELQTYLTEGVRKS